MSQNTSPNSYTFVLQNFDCKITYEDVHYCAANGPVTWRNEVISRHNADCKVRNVYWVFQILLDFTYSIRGSRTGCDIQIGRWDSGANLFACFQWRNVINGRLYVTHITHLLTHWVSIKILELIRCCERVNKDTMFKYCCPSSLQHQALNEILNNIIFQRFHWPNLHLIVFGV